MVLGRQRHALYVLLLQLFLLSSWVLVHWGEADATPINLLTNGTFDSDLSGWTVSSQTHAGCVNYSPTYQVPSQLYSGGAVWLNACNGPTNKPEISQTISTSVGATYLITGYIQKGFYVLPPPNEFIQFEVLAGGTSQSLTFGTPNANGWSQFSASFVATSTSTVILFGAERTADIDYRVDSLSVVMTDDGSTTSSSAPTTAAPTTAPSTSSTPAPPPVVQAEPEISVAETTTTTAVPAIDPSSTPVITSNLPETGANQSWYWLASIVCSAYGSLLITAQRRQRT